RLLEVAAARLGLGEVRRRDDARGEVLARVLEQRAGALELPALDLDLREQDARAQEVVAQLERTVERGLGVLERAALELDLAQRGERRRVGRVERARAAQLMLGAREVLARQRDLAGVELELVLVRMALAPARDELGRALERARVEVRLGEQLEQREVVGRAPVHGLEHADRRARIAREQ